MTDYTKTARRLRDNVGTTGVYEKTFELAVNEAADLCDVAAKATAEIDVDEERAHCESVAREECTPYNGNGENVRVCYERNFVKVVFKQREDARLQATLAAHAAYRELTDALAEFFYCGDPDDLKRVERAFDKTRDL